MSGSTPPVPENGRFQVTVAGTGNALVAVLLDTVTGRSWHAAGLAWQPMTFMGDALPAPPFPPPKRPMTELLPPTAGEVE
ncbi:hypothetical protein ACQW02_16755 [Humitalea sp. 24SJ18S-53]|uniref:hypothetical protein n=1 Tax=Humitalea sp. 24SJ18S-53 TaxID=3422307 RepID=UPI003D663F05